MQKVEFSSNNENETSTNSNTDDKLDLPQTPSQPKCFWLINVVSPGLASALGRTKGMQ